MSDPASKALVLANMIERYNAGVGSQKMCDDYSEAARCLRSQEARIVALTDALDRAEKAQLARAVPLLTEAQVLALRSENGWSKETIRAIEQAVRSKLGLQNKD